MKVGRGETNHLFVDVDGTLLIWPKTPGSAEGVVRTNAIAARAGEPHDTAILPKVNKRLVEQLRAWHAAGGVIVIWTLGGKAWAEMARDFCGLQGLERVICMAKPDLAIDDNPHLWGEGSVLVVAPDAFKVLP